MDPNQFDRKMKQDVIIIGCGLAGLQCGYILSKRGYRVCLLEQHSQIGGCLQTFRRQDALFDTGFHFVGGLDEGQPLHRLFRFFDLLDLPWQQLDEEGFAEVHLNGTTYRLPSGYERYVDYLSTAFPHQKDQLKRYVDLLQQVESTLFQSLTGDGNSVEYFNRSAWDFLEETIDDPLLRNLLSATSLTMELDKEHLPLYVFAQINNSFIRSSWRLQGGGSLIADRLAETIRQNGGTILTNARLTALTETDGKITSVTYNDTEQLEADWFISTLHPAQTLSLVPETRLIRKIYRKRIASLANTFGMFTVHLRLKKGILPYQNRNLFLYSGQEVWDYSSEETAAPVMVSYYAPEEGAFAEQVDLLTPVRWEEVARWEETTIGRRGDDYKAFKQQKAEGCIAVANAHIPGLQEAIEKVYTSSPLTYRDYTGIPQGSAFGIQKDCTNVMGTLIPVQTQIPNLLLSGQNLNLHGVLGVSMTSLFTCARIVGMEALKNELITE